MMFCRSMTVQKNVIFVNKTRGPKVNHLAPVSNLKKNQDYGVILDCISKTFQNS